jgi:hypothetical protein
VFGLSFEFKALALNFQPEFCCWISEGEFIAMPFFDNAIRLCTVFHLDVWPGNWQQSLWWWRVGGKQ